MTEIEISDVMFGRYILVGNPWFLLKCHS